MSFGLSFDFIQIDILCVFVCVGGCVWSTEDLRVSMLCVLWLQGEADDLLLSGGLDQCLHLWRRQRHEETLTLAGLFGGQKGAILALNQNATHVASASGQFDTSTQSFVNLVGQCYNNSTTWSVSFLAS